MKKNIKKMKPSIIAMEYTFPTIYNRSMFYVKFVIMDGEIIEHCWDNSKHTGDRYYKDDFVDAEWERNLKETVYILLTSIETLKKNLVDFQDMYMSLNKDSVGYKSCTKGIKQASDLYQNNFALMEALIEE